jgi:hypothetical protein
VGIWKLKRQERFFSYLNDVCNRYKHHLNIGNSSLIFDSAKIRFGATFGKKIGITV